MNVKNQTLVIIGLLVLLTVALRIPNTYGEINPDSNRAKEMANFYINEGYYSGNAHPLSIFGLYPYSYAQGVPIILATLSLVLGLDISTISIIFPMLVGLIGLVGIMMLASEITKDKLMQIIIAFLFITHLGFLYYSRYNLSSRGLFIALIPFYTFFLLKIKKNKAYIPLAVILFLFFILVHRIFVMIIALTILFYVTKIVIHYIPKIKPLRIKNNQYFLIYAILCLLLFFIPFLLDLDIGLNFFQNKDVFTTITLTLATFARMTGYLVVLIPLGVFILLIKKQKKLFEYYLLAVFLFTLPLLKSTVYIPEILSVFYSIFIAIGVLYIIQILKNINLKALTLFAIIFLQIIIGIIFQVWQPGFIDPRQSSLDRTIDNKDLILSEFIQKNVEENIISDNPVESARMSAINYCNFIYEGYTLIGCGIIDYNEFKQHIIPNNKIFHWLTSPYILESGSHINYYIDWLKLHRTIDSKEVITLLQKYDIGYLLTNDKIHNSNSQLVRSTDKQKNRIYDNGEQILFDIN